MSSTPPVDPLWYLNYRPKISESSKPAPSFDYSQGRVFLHEGTIFYSPNCSRPVIIPPRTVHITDPFTQTRLNASDFKQAVWWSEYWGWMSFIPLAPSFTSAPFATFSWVPRIDQLQVCYTSASGEIQTETRFKMFEEDISNWKRAEEQLVEAALRLQLFFGLQASTPPKPSSFHYDRPHKSHGIARRMIHVSRDWFVIWMGFVSYLISEVELCPPGRHRPLDDSSPLPDWYKCLKDVHNYPDFWLNGLTSSSVCSFDRRTPRAGIIFRWAEQDLRRPPIEWFAAHHVPLWFTWTSAEERAIRSNPSLAYLEPPVALVQEALTLLFTVPNLALAGLVTRKYFQLGNDKEPISKDILDILRLENAPSFVLSFTREQFLDQIPLLRQTEATSSDPLKALLASRRQENRAAAEAAVSFPAQGMIEPSQVETQGKLFNHFDDFFSAREKRQAELRRVETPQVRQSRESRERAKPIKSAKMYVWERVQSSGGREMYMRVHVNKRQNEDVYSQFRSAERLYNAQANEWDFSEEFSFATGEGESDTSSEFEDEDEYGDEPYQFISEQVIRRSRSRSPPPADHVMEVVPPKPYSRDPLETMKLVYGYTSPLVAIEDSNEHTWESILRTLGFVLFLDELSVSDSDQRGIRLFFSQIIKNLVVTPHLYDLDAANYHPLADLFRFADVQRPSKDLFVFSSPRSMACNWVLGVHSATVALYICRYLLDNPHAHTLITIAHRLLERGIRFRTLLALPCSPRHSSISQPYVASSHRVPKHNFTVSDFETAMLHCRALLSLPQGRAALLQGGIVGRIAKEYLSLDGALAGPSIEVTLHRVGYLAPSGTDGIQYCDDELTQNEIAIICGTYTFYTAYGNQEATHSWFPPPSAWYANRSGVRWPEWTERCEDVFGKLLEDIRNGKGKPRSNIQWVTHLRGHKLTRGLVDSSESQAEAFIDEVVPIH